MSKLIYQKTLQTLVTFRKLVTIATYHHTKVWQGSFAKCTLC